MGSGYGSYIDLDFDKAQKISKILTSQLSDGSSTEEDSDKPTRKRGGNRRVSVFLRSRKGLIFFRLFPGLRQPRNRTRMQAVINGGRSSHS